MPLRLLAFLILPLIMISTDSTKPDNEFGIFIRVCAAGVDLELKDTTYYLSSTWPVRKDTVQIAKQDLKKLKASVEDMFMTSGDEFWSVPCVSDGFHLKLYLSLNQQTKKIYIGNYFDLRYNEIALILNKYLPEDSEYHYRLPYGISDPKHIKEALERSKNDPELYPECQAPEHYKQRMLHEWCES